MEQQTLDLDKCVGLMEQAIARVEVNADEQWKGAALNTIWLVAQYRHTLTTDDIWIMLELCSPDVATHEPRAMGPMMRQAQACGWITPTTRHRLSVRKACHRRPLRVWESTFANTLFPEEEDRK